MHLLKTFIILDYYGYMHCTQKISFRITKIALNSGYKDTRYVFKLITNILTISVNVTEQDTEIIHSL